MATILAIGAHVGDMELTCGAVLASHALQGDRIVTVALTAGEKGNPPGMTPAEYRCQKVREAQEFAKALGGEALVFDTPDGMLTYDEKTLWQVCDTIRSVRPNAIITHWRESVHKDHAAASRIVSHARYYAANAGFERPLPAHPCSKLFFAENLEDAKDFKPYLYVDVSKGYELWRREIMRHWFVTHSTDHRYLDYYDALSICRGCESGYERAQAFMVREGFDKVSCAALTDF